jgi:hypothetical protein
VTTLRANVTTFALLVDLRPGWYRAPIPGLRTAADG